MLSNLKQNNKHLYYSLLCGASSVVILGLSTYLYINRNSLCLCSNKKDKSTSCCITQKTQVTDACKCDPCLCDPCRCVEKKNDGCKCDDCECDDCEKDCDDCECCDNN